MSDKEKKVAESETKAKKPVKVKKEKKDSIGLFQKPSLQEIQNYCSERKNTVNCYKFFNYYESNGWKVGKNPMKDWKAAVRTWEQKQTKEIDGWNL